MSLALSRIPLINRLFGAPSPPESDQARAHRLVLTDNLTFEVVPLENVTSAAEALPPGARVAVTASPARGLAATQELTDRLMTEGFHVTPHIAARQVSDRTHAQALAGWFRSSGVSTMLLVGGDSEEPGQYSEVVEFLADFLGTDHRLTSIGVAAYPDGHPVVDHETMHQALHAKQQILAEAKVTSYCTTQMCFNPDTISDWLRAERAAGLTMPVHLGLAGVVDRTKLLTMGAQLGIGQSLSYLRKNRKAVTSMMTTVRYDPNNLLIPLSEDMVDLGIEDLHVFTFNQVSATNQWREAQQG